MTRILTIIALLFATPILAGCVVEPIAISGDNLYYEHGTARTPDAIRSAAEICRKRGKTAEMKVQNCPFRCNTTFQCVGGTLANGKPKITNIDGDFFTIEQRSVRGKGISDEALELASRHCEKENMTQKSLGVFWNGSENKLQAMFKCKKIFY